MIPSRTWLVLVAGLAMPGVAASIVHCGSRIIDAVDLVSATDADEDSGAAVPSDFIWYVLDETQGTTAKDSSFHHYDITGLAGVTWAQGADFNGIDGGGSVDVDPSYRSPPITISAWLRPRARADRTSNQYGLLPYPTNAFGDDDPQLFGYGIGLNVWTDGDGGAALAAEDVDTCTSRSTCVAGQNVGDAGPFAAGREYFIVSAIGLPVDDASPPSAQVYVNGALYDQTIAALPAVSAQTTLRLGRHNADPRYGSKSVFAGRIRDARVYKRVLDAAEVAQLFASGPTTKAPSSSRTAAMVDGPSD